MTKYIAQQDHRDLASFDGSVIQWPAFARSNKDSKNLFSATGIWNRLQKTLKGKALTLALTAVPGLLFLLRL